MQKPALEGDGHGGGAGIDAELVVYAGEMGLDRALRDAQPPGDLLAASSDTLNTAKARVNRA